MLTQRTNYELKYRSVKYRITRSQSQNQQYSQPGSTLRTTLFPASAENKSGKKIRPVTKFMPYSTAISFRTALNPEKQREGKTVSVRKRRVHRDNFQITPHQSKQSTERVQLPTLKQGDSYFTVLDNINLPIIFLNSSICQINKNFKQDNETMGQLRSDLQIIKKTHLKKLEDIEKQGINGFDRLRGLLQIDRASHQENLMRTKRMIGQCSSYLPELTESIQKTKQKLLFIQTVIFSNAPFQLAFSQDNEDSVPSFDYF